MQTGGLWWQIQLFVVKCMDVCQKIMVFQTRWSFMAVVSEDSLHCVAFLTYKSNIWNIHVPEIAEIPPWAANWKMGVS